MYPSCITVLFLCIVDTQEIKASSKPSKPTSFEMPSIDLNEPLPEDEDETEQLVSLFNVEVSEQHTLNCFEKFLEYTTKPEQSEMFIVLHKD